MYEIYEKFRSHLASRLEPVTHEAERYHRVHCAANYAIRVQAYRKIGGLKPLPTGEDLDLHQRLLGIGGRVRHSFRSEVSTSGRLNGRVAGGLAGSLRGWSPVVRTRGDYLVESPQVLQSYYVHRNLLRSEIAGGGSERLGEIAEGLRMPGITAAWLQDELRTKRATECLMLEIEGRANARELLEPTAFEEAIREGSQLLMILTGS